MDAAPTPAGPATAPLTPNQQATRQKILSTTTTLLGRGGLNAATMHAITTHTGVSNATIYCLWPTRSALLADAFTAAIATPGPREPAASVTDELVHTAEQLSEIFRSPLGSTLLELRATTDRLPELLHLRTEVLQPWYTRIHNIWHTGVVHGDFTDTVPAATATDHLIAAALIGTTLSIHQPSADPVTTHIHLALHGLHRR